MNCETCGAPSLFGTCTACFEQGKREAAQAEIAFGHLTNATWSTAKLREIMEPLSRPALVHIWGEYAKFGMMFGAGRHIKRVASDILAERREHEQQIGAEWLVHVRAANADSDRQSRQELADASGEVTVKQLPLLGDSWLPF